MNWKLVATEDLQTILKLYEEVFGDAISEKDYKDRTAGYSVHEYFVHENGGSPVGFAVFRGKSNSVELWNCGILPQHRRQGAGACILEGGQKLMAELGYTRMSVSTFNRWNIMLSMLTKRGFRICGTRFSDRHEDFKIELETTLRQRKELRYALTEKCNFKCLFCHNEGLGQALRSSEKIESVLAILKSAVDLGYTDITFTGGEPLLEKERCFYLLSSLGALPNPPDITLVTNGSLLDDKAIKNLNDYRGKLKIHISLHATDPRTFNTVTGTTNDNLFAQVQNNIEQATKSGLKVIWNYVVLNNFNHDKIIEAVDIARKIGVSGIKLLELLVLSSNADDYRLFCKVNTLDTVLSRIAHGPEKKGLRKSVFYHKDDTRFTLEVQRLTCALGCAHCREVRDRQLSSDLCYHPCFVRSDRHYKITDPSELESIFKDGDRIIDGHAGKFGNKSPTLIKQDIYTPGKKEVFFLLDDKNRFEKFLENKGFHKDCVIIFAEEYYRPQNAGVDWTRFERILKIGEDTDDRTKIDLVYTDHKYKTGKNGCLEAEVKFLFPSGPVRLESWDYARHFLKKMDFASYLNLDWTIVFWRSEEYNSSINVGTSGKVTTLKIEDWSEDLDKCFELFGEYEGKIEPLRVPLISYFLDHPELSPSETNQPAS